MKFVKYMQEGGQMAAPEAPVEEQAAAQDPMAQLIEMAMQAVQANDAQMALQVCAALVQLAQGGAEAGAGAEQAPAEEPMFRKGGCLVKKAKKAARGMKFGKKC